MVGEGSVITSPKVAPSNGPTTRVVPLSSKSQSTNMMRFDNNRKSYVTAQLSGKEDVSDLELPAMGPPDVTSDTPRG